MPRRPPGEGVPDRLEQHAGGEPPVAEPERRRPLENRRHRRVGQHDLEEPLLVRPGIRVRPQIRRRMPDAVASSAETSRITAIATCGPVRPFVSSSDARCSTRRRAGSRRRRAGRDRSSRGYSAPLVEGTSVTRGSIATACAQRPGQRLELALDDVVGVAAGVEHPHVQADPRVEGEGLQHVRGQRWSGSPGRSSASCSRARSARSTAGRRGRRPPGRAPRPSGSSRRRSG